MRWYPEGKSFQGQPFFEFALRSTLDLGHGARHLLEEPNGPPVGIDVRWYRRYNPNDDGHIDIRDTHVKVQVKSSVS
jgi:hypothetical protein